MKFFLPFFLFSIFAYSQIDYNNGYSKGYAEGYCFEDFGCIPPIAPVASVGFDTYQDGYNKGFSDGKSAKEKEKIQYNNLESQNNNSNPYDYNSNPYVQPNVQPVDFGEIALQFAAMRPRVSAVTTFENKPLYGENLNQYKYFVLLPPKKYVRDIKRNLTKKWRKNLPELVITQKPYQTHNGLPDDLKANPNLAIYADIYCQAPYLVETYIRLYDNSGRLLYSFAKEALSASSAFKNLISDLTFQDYRFQPSLVQEPMNLSNPSTVDNNQLSKDQAIEQIKKLKELLDSGILSEKEYNTKAEELKKIILGN